eukprot:952394-Karenia_brevis.AAC.1
MMYEPDETNGGQAEIVLLNCKMYNSGDTTISATLQLCRSEVEYGSTARRQIMLMGYFLMPARTTVQLSCSLCVRQYAACLSLSWLHSRPSSVLAWPWHTPTCPV